MRFLVPWFVGVLLFATNMACAQTTYPLTVTDSIGRKVTIPTEPKAVLLGSGFSLIALSLVHPDPASIMAGWASDLKSNDAAFYERFSEKFPALREVPIIGDGITISIEKMLSVKSDLVILSDWHLRGADAHQAIDYLEKAGVPVVVLDFGSRALKNTPTNMRLLGQILNRQEQANAFADFYEERIEKIRNTVAKNGAGPSVFLEAYPNVGSCCYAYGSGSLGEFITLTGSRNIASAIPNEGAIIGAEFILAANPDVYIATSSPGKKFSGFSIGPGVSKEEARETLNRALQNPFRENLKAVQEKRVYGLWNFFNAVPLNFLAAEAFAKWLVQISFRMSIPT